MPKPSSLTPSGNTRPLPDRAPRPDMHDPVPRVPSARLLEGARELVIEHQGNEYHLRLTRNDKLILTK